MFSNITLSKCFFVCLLSLVFGSVILHLQMSAYQEAEIDYEHRPKISTTLSNQHKFSNIELAKPTNLSIEALRERIEAENREQVIWNANRFPWPSVNKTSVWPNGIVITIQVHNRISYLRKLLHSLSQARWIDRALLIFSHNIYSEELNELIRSIPFAAVMQIHFPYSTQLFPSMFPGESPDDCPRDMAKEKAVQIGCTNALTPDLYGHYREARYSQTKHHWWWKVNFMFSKVRALKDHYGQILFMEEDHFVAEDFLHVLWLQQQQLRGSTDCPFCNQASILSIGSYPKVFTHRTEAEKVLLMPWSSNNHNMGMAFNRTVWHEFRQCAQMFCTVDDYNWDWSLLHVAQKCLPTLHGEPPPKGSSRPKFILSALVLKAPRVFHIGECGVHHRKANCASDTTTLRKAEAALNAARKAGTLFPTGLKVNNTLKSKITPLKKSNGGWGDPRDWELCLSLTQHEG